VNSTVLGTGYVAGKAISTSFAIRKRSISMVFHSKRTFVLCFCAPSSIALLACRSEVSPKATITIQKIEPPNDSPLLTGENLLITVIGLAHHAPENATAALIIQGSAGQAVAISEPIKVKSNEKFTLSAQVAVPTGSGLNVNIALYKDALADSLAVDWRDYKIVGIKK
jgi:hypothetical protein